MSRWKITLRNPATGAIYTVCRTAAARGTAHQMMRIDYPNWDVLTIQKVAWA